MKKQLLPLMVLACLMSCLMSGPAFAVTASHFDETSKYASSMDNANLLPTCGPNQMLTYNGSAYGCVDNYTLNCVAGKVLLGTNPDGAPVCTDSFNACTPPSVPANPPYDADGNIQCTGSTSTGATTFPSCTAKQILNTTDGVTFTCEDIAERVNVPVGALGGGCSATNAKIRTRGGDATGGGYNTLPAVEVFSTQCSSGCNSWCSKQAKFNAGFIVGYGGGDATCLCIR